MRKLYEAPKSVPNIVQVSLPLMEYDLFSELGKFKEWNSTV